jgi:arginyl-tRNA--protein-N-Asp/Glu arginylyltransferase
MLERILLPRVRCLRFEGTLNKPICIYKPRCPTCTSAANRISAAQSKRRRICRKAKLRSEQADLERETTEHSELFDRIYDENSELRQQVANADAIATAYRTLMSTPRE